MLYNNFNKALAAGEVGEELTASILSQNGYKVTDVSDNEEYFSKDIDLLADYGDSQHLEIEVKSDSRVASTGNVVLETMTNVSRNKKGWFHTTKASHIFFVDVKQNIIHCVRLNELKEVYEKNKFILKELRTHQYECGYIYKESEIVLMPVSLLKTTQHYVKLSA